MTRVGRHELWMKVICQSWSWSKSFWISLGKVMRSWRMEYLLLWSWARRFCMIQAKSSRGEKSQDDSVDQWRTHFQIERVVTDVKCLMENVKSELERKLDTCKERDWSNYSLIMDVYDIYVQGKIKRRTYNSNETNGSDLETIHDLIWWAEYRTNRDIEVVAIRARFASIEDGRETFRWSLWSDRWRNFVGSGDEESIFRNKTNMKVIKTERIVMRRENR